MGGFDKPKELRHSVNLTKDAVKTIHLEHAVQKQMDRLEEALEAARDMPLLDGKCNMTMFAFELEKAKKLVQDFSDQVAVVEGRFQTMDMIEKFPIGEDTAFRMLLDRNPFDLDRALSQWRLLKKLIGKRIQMLHQMEAILLGGYDEILVEDLDYVLWPAVF